MSERQGVEIDYCPNCRGVWLDRGELDKIIERVNASGESYRSVPQNQAYSGQRYDERDYDDDLPSTSRDTRYGSDSQKPKKRGMLGDLFDIFD